MLCKVLLITVVIALVSSADCYREGRVVNGTSTAIRKYPFMISLRDQNGKHGCAGTILDAKWILTAAHCINNTAANKISVQYGVTQIGITGQNIVGVKRIIMHEKFDKPKEFDNDIALLELKQAIKLNNKNIAAVKLPQANFEIPQNQQSVKGSLAGWGLTDSEGDVQTNLREVHLKIYSDRECNVRFGNTTKNQICGGVDDGTKGQCNADSGGPLLYQNNIQLGIVSMGKLPCGKTGSPGLYTKVSHYINWINQHKK